MLVYRIENELGQGPFTSYSADEYDNHKDGRSNSARRPPGPHSEYWGKHQPRCDLGWTCSNARYGFRSINQLKKWFTSARGRRAMEADGSFITVLEVDQMDCWLGKWQLVFHKDRATKVKRLSVVDFKEIVS